MMNWKTTYDNRTCTAEEAVRRIQSGDRVFLTGNCSVPQKTAAAFADRALVLHDVEVIEVLTVGASMFAQPALRDHIRVNSMFISSDVRDAVNEGFADFTPIYLSEMPGLFGRELPIDVALIQVSPPDTHGFCSFGVEVGVTKSATESAQIVIAEVNPNMPRTLGDSFIHVSKLDCIVEVDYPLPEIQMSESSDIEDAIALHLVDLIEDGSTLQTGIGGIPNAVLHHLDDKRHLGIHTELFSDGIIDLVQRGVITNAAKTLHPGKIIAGMVLGTQQLYDFVHDNPMVEMRPTEYVNDPFVIAQNEKMVSINSAIEVDLTGQVCADSIGHRFYSGAGGQIDFVRGAARSRRGKSIIALPSTAKNGEISRISAALRPGAGVTTTRNSVRYVATEYGVASLHGKTIRQRAEALIQIAHPDFRDELSEQARELHYLPVLYAGVDMLSSP